MVLVPGVLALLPEYSGMADPVAELRAACLAAVGWLTEGLGGGMTDGLGEDGPDRGVVTVVADESGQRVAAALLAAADRSGANEPFQSQFGEIRDSNGAYAPVARPPGPGRCLVVGNGSARRSEKAPGHLDERSFAFDDALDLALRAPDPDALAGLDRALGDELLADVASLGRLGDLLDDAGAGAATVDYADDPFGVQYWVMRWQCDS